MQGAIENASPNWIQIAFGLVAAFVTGGGFFKLITIWLSRGEREARARKIDAETRQLDVQVQQMRGDIVLEFIDRLTAQQARVDQLIKENQTSQETIARQSAQIQKQVIEMDLSDKQIKRIKGLLDAPQIKLSELDDPKSY
jgi:hypothetical protein